MKKTLLIIILSVVVFAGCSTKLTQKQLFEKKQACFSYRESLQKQIDRDKSEAKTYGGDYQESIDEIFYSIKENSCFATTSTLVVWNNAGGKTVNSTDTIIDLLSNKSWQYTIKEANLYNEKLKELKGK